NLGILLAPLRRARRKESVDTEWGRIGVVTKKLCAKRAADFQKVLAPPPSSNGHGTGGVGTAIESLTFSNRPQPRAALSWRENRVFRRRFVRSYPNFQLEILLRFSTKSIEGDSAEFSAEGKNVICARHSPGVGHAQDLARIPKWKLGRVLSIWYQSIEGAGAAQAPMATGPVALEPPSSPYLLQPTSTPAGRPELAGKSCFPTEVRPKLPKLPARNSPSFLHQIDRAVEVRGIHHRANYSFRTKVEIFGISQNTGETLPNFRQKSKEILKRNL
ncbi:RNA-dependent RNA polymerase family protein, partial [Prunus dulcis]